MHGRVWHNVPITTHSSFDVNKVCIVLTTKHFNQVIILKRTAYWLLTVLYHKSTVHTVHRYCTVNEHSMADFYPYEYVIERTTSKRKCVLNQTDFQQLCPPLLDTCPSLPNCHLKMWNQQHVLLKFLLFLIMIDTHNGQLSHQSISTVTKNRTECD